MMHRLLSRTLLVGTACLGLCAQAAFAENSSIVEPKNNPTIHKGKADKFDYTHTFYRERTSEAGKTKREYVTKTLPGEELIGVATYLYTHTDPADEITFTLPLPEQVYYVRGSATNEKNVWFSVDKGASWAHFRDLRVNDTNGTKRIATGKDITNLQWRLNESLKKGDEGTLEYRIVVR